MADSTTQYQISGGYSSGSDSDDTETTTSMAQNTHANNAAVSLAEGIVKQQQMYIYSEEYEVSAYFFFKN